MVGSDLYKERVQNAYNLGKMRKALRNLVDAVDDHAKYNWITLDDEEALQAARELLEEE